MFMFCLSCFAPGGVDAKSLVNFLVYTLPSSYTSSSGGGDAPGGADAKVLANFWAGLTPLSFALLMTSPEGEFRP